MSRLTRLRQQLTSSSADALLVTDAKNIYYLSGFRSISPDERESILFVTQSHAYLFVSRMYAAHARHEVHESITVIDDLTNGLLCSFMSHIDTSAHILCEAHNMTLAEKSYIEEKTGHTLFPSRNIISQLRLHKDKQEIASLRKTAAITDKTFDHIQTFITTHFSEGLCEKDIIQELRRFSESIGSERFGFDPIVAVNAGAAQPHYISNNAPLTRGSVLLIDMGFVIDGYTSDFTRTLVIGEASEGFAFHYELVQQAHAACVAAVKPGANVRDLYNISADIFSDADVLPHYIHSLGHGVGLHIHESPSLSPRSDELLAPGMVITIEPGLYFERNYGIRIEDLLLVTKTGYEYLTKSTRDLISLTV